MGLIKCKKCGTDNSDDDTIFCKKCGSQLEKAPICPKCGKVAKDSDTEFCQQCGNRIKEPPKLPQCWNCGFEIINPKTPCCPKCTVLLERPSQNTGIPPLKTDNKNIINGIKWIGILILAFCIISIIFALVFTSNGTSGISKKPTNSQPDGTAFYSDDMRVILTTAGEKNPSFSKIPLENIPKNWIQITEGYTFSFMSPAKISIIIPPSATGKNYAFFIGRYDNKDGWVVVKSYPDGSNQIGATISETGIYALMAYAPESNLANAPSYSTVLPTTNPTTVSQSQFSDTLKKELQKVVIGGDVTEVNYYPDTKHLVIWLNCEGWDTKSTRTAYVHSTFEIMSILTKYSDKIDSITIAGKTLMLDSKGQESLTKVFQVKTTMANAKTVNWKNLYGFDPIEALNNNFESVWWHRAIAP